ncbi:anti-sigma factor [Methylobacterium sp. A54F]
MSAGPEGGDADRDLRAAEYVLGTLPPAERAAFAIERSIDPAAEAAARAWESRLAPLDAAAPEVRPDARVWARIAAALPGAVAANDDDRVGALTRKLRFWRGAAAAGGLLAAGLALAVGAGLLRPQPAGRYIAVVQSGGAQPALIVSVDTATGTAQVRPVEAAAPAGRSLELWYVAAGAAPRSLGLVGAAPGRVAVPGADASGVLAVSSEPPGGSPTGQPTGPVLYTGKLIRE